MQGGCLWRGYSMGAGSGRILRCCEVDTRTPSSPFEILGKMCYDTVILSAFGRFLSLYL